MKKSGCLLSALPQQEQLFLLLLKAQIGIKVHVQSSECSPSQSLSQDAEGRLGGVCRACPFSLPSALWLCMLTSAHSRLICLHWT